MFVGKLLKSLGFLIVLDNNYPIEKLPEYAPFFNDLEKEYNINSKLEVKDILRVMADRHGYRRLNDDEERKKRFSLLLDTHYNKYKTAINNSQYINEKSELKRLIKYINGHGTWDIYFHQMHYITQDAIYYSMSKLNPQIHQINKFFIDYFNNMDGTRHEHEEIFNFSHTLRSPFFRGSLMAYVSNSLTAVERSPLFVMFMVPINLTPFGEEHLSEIINLFENKMIEYESRNGITIARDCYKKPSEMNERKLKKIINRLIRESENELRRGMRLPAVGEGYLQETILFYKIQTAFPNIEVIHRGKLEWLGSQHLDIWIPSRFIAVEYNGRQHYEAIDYFGGINGLIKQQELDARKAALCSDNGVRLFIVRYDEDMDIAVSRIRAEVR